MNYRVKELLTKATNDPNFRATGEQVQFLIKLLTRYERSAATWQSKYVTLYEETFGSLGE